MSVVTLASMKEFLRLTSTAHDTLLETLLTAAQEYIADQCDLLDSSADAWPELPKLAMKMLVAGWFTQPEGYSAQDVKESPALQAVIKLHKGWVPQ